MKKRLFAGALALLMIIGLLPVSSMLKKPIEAQAAQRTYSYKITSSDTSTTFAANTETKIGTDEFFTFFNNSTSNVGCNTGVTVDNVKHYGMKLSKNTSQGIRFRVASEKAKITVVCPLNVNSNKTAAVVLAKTGDSDTVQKNFKNTSSSKVSVLQTFVFEIEGSGEYSLYRGGDSTVFIESIEVTEDPYTITVNDEKAAYGSQSVSTFYKEGESVSYTAQGEEANFDYWENSHGVKVSTNRTLNIPVYYSDTYTAVYKKTGAKVVYYTPYGGVYKTYYKGDEFTGEPDVPTLYGYASGNWNNDYATVKDLLDNATDSYEISVKPEYPTNDSSMNYTIKIDATKFGKENVEELSKVVNELVTASIDANKENFAYWKDDKGNIVSYNPTYYFLANRDVIVTAVSTEEATDTEKKGVITQIKYDETSRTVIFEYTVPDDFTMNYVGVLGSTNEDILTNAVVNNETKGVYQLGNSNCSGYKTFRYTLNITGSETWYVKPVLIYSNAGGVQQDPVYGSKLTIK